MLLFWIAFTALGNYLVGDGGELQGYTSIVGSYDDYDTEAEALELALRIQAARCSKNAEKFIDLFDRGNVFGYPSPSEADLALMDQIPFWVYTMGGDTRERMLAMFMLSALATRDKWTEDKYKQYRDLTLDKALQGWKESGRKYYDPENFGRLQWPETEITSKKGKPTPRRKSRLNVDYLLAWLGVTVRFNRVSKLPEFSGLDKLLCGNNKLTFEASIAALHSLTVSTVWLMKIISSLMMALTSFVDFAV